MNMGHKGTARKRRAVMTAMWMATVAVGAIVMAPPVQAQSEHSFDIPAQALSEALVQFAAQSGYQVASDGAAISGVRSQGVRGALLPVEALSQLLSGTGFTFRITGNIVTIERAPQTTGGAIQLGAVRVEGDSSAGRPSGDTRGTYTVPVTSSATGLNLSIRQTPQSVTVITRQVMDDKGIDDLVDVVEHTAGLSINRYESNRGSMYSRGFKIESYQIDGSPASIDEQWSAGEILNSTVLYDRIDVLRGADGLMTGTGNPSATINMVRKRADSYVFTGNAAVEAGSWGHHGATVDLSSPLTQSGATRGRFVADYDKSDSYIDRLENRSHVLYATVAQDIGEKTVLSAGISHQDNRTSRPTWGGLPMWAVDGNNEIVPLNLHRDWNPAVNWAYWNAKYTSAFVQGEHDFGNGWHLKASYAHGDRKSEAKIILPSPYPIDMETGKSVMAMFGMKFPVPGFAGIYYVDTVKDDLKIEANGDFSLFGRGHEVVFGYEQSKEDFVSDASVGLMTLDLTPSIYEVDQPHAQPDYNTRNNYKDHEIEQNAFYVAGRFSLLDRLSLVLGSRLIDYQVTDNKTPGNSYESNNRVVPYAGLVFDITRNLSVYTSYTTIFQPQNNLDAGGKILHPIEGNTHEIGLKGEFFDERLNATLSVYRMEQDNVAKADGRVPLDPNDPDGPTRAAYIGVKGVVSRGFEADVTGEIRPNWHVTAGYSQFKARTASGTDINTLVPRKQFNLFTTYQFTGDWKDLTIGGGARWQSEIWVHQAVAATLGVPKLTQDAYVVADVMARYQINGRWSAQMNVQNLLDEDYYAPTDDGMQVFWQSPRSVELKLKYQF